ncbi:MAG: hypothetical protein AB8B37_07475 [Prochlorococcus sp.]
MAQVQALASTMNLVRCYFPAGRPNLSPWQDDPQTREWIEPESLDLSSHFPGWSSRLQCSSFLIQLQFSASSLDQESPRLLGVLIRGMNYDGELRRLVTVGDWLPQGSHLPHPAHSAELQQICRDLFKLFPSEVPLNELQ